MLLALLHRRLWNWAAAAWALALLLAPTDSLAGRAPADENPPSPLASLAAWQTAMARTTGLPNAPIHLVEGDASMLERLLQGALQRQYPGNTLAYMTGAYRDIGLLESDVDLRQAALAMYEDEVVGFFDPASRTMAIMKTAPSSAKEQVLRHELVHAQQDALLPLQPLIEAAASNDDRALALQAVLEGQAAVAASAAALTAVSAPTATAVDASIGFALKDAGIDIRDEELAGLLGAQAELTLPDESVLAVVEQVGALASQVAPSLGGKRRPAYLQAQLLFPYQQGAQFIATLQQGTSLPNVIATTLKRLPQTTREILHPELYREGYRPEVLLLPTVTAMPDVHVVFSTQVGEWNMRTLLGGSDEPAQRLRSDRLVVAQSSNGDRVTAWLTQWQDAKSAKAFVRALRNRWKTTRTIAGTDQFSRGDRLDTVWQRGSGVAVLSQPSVGRSPVAAALQTDLQLRNP